MSITQIQASNLPVTSSPVDSKNPIDVNIQSASGTAVISGTFSPVGLKTKGLITMLAIDNTQWYEAPATPLTNRNNVMIQNPATNPYDLIYNYDPEQPLTSGVHVAPGVSVSIAIQGSIPVYVTVAGSNSLSVPVEELA